MYAAQREAARAAQQRKLLEVRDPRARAALVLLLSDRRPSSSVPDNQGLLCNKCIPACISRNLRPLVGL